MEGNQVGFHCFFGGLYSLRLECCLIFADVFLSWASCEFKKSSIDIQPIVYYDILPTLLLCRSLQLPSA